MYHEDEGVKFDESVSRPGNAIGKGGKGDEKRHVLHAFSCNHHFLHRLNRLIIKFAKNLFPACLIIFILGTSTVIYSNQNLGNRLKMVTIDLGEY